MLLNGIDSRGVSLVLGIGPADAAEDLSPLLHLLTGESDPAETHARADEVKRPEPGSQRPPHPRPRPVLPAPPPAQEARDALRQMRAVMPKGRNFH